METYVFDKAKYHFDSVAAAGLPLEQAYVHTGMFFGWLLEHGLCDTELFPEATVAQFKSRQLTGPRIFEKEADGVLTSDMLTRDGDSFSKAYFDFEKGKFADDYQELVLKSEDESRTFSGEDTWDSYFKLAARIDGRFAEWKSTQRKS